MNAPGTDRPVTDTDVGTQDITREEHDSSKCRTDRDEFIAWLTASCQRQALAVIVRDPTTLAAVATVLR
jgi:hypothetical protein